MTGEIMSHGQRRRVLGGTMAALFLAAFGNTIVATVLPAIIADLGGFARYAWPSTAYMVTSTTAMPIAGKLSDLYGRRLLFLFGVAALVLSSLPVALSQSMDQLILFRAIQGIGGGVILVTSIAAAGTSTLQFHRAVGGTVGVAIMGAVVAQRTKSRLSDLLPETSRAQLPEGWLESATGAGVRIVSGASEGTGLVDAVADHFAQALTGALGDAFALAAAVAVLSLVATLFLPRRMGN